MTIPIDLPRPIESMALPMAMNGNTGSNRAQTDAKKQIEANDDMAAIQAWLAEFRDSPQTLRHYRKEAERLLLWALIERGKPLSSLSREDCLLYEDFLANPEPHERWCGPKVPRNHPGWRPFLGPLNPPSRRTALLVINSLFSYLVKAGYLSGNPLALLKRRGRKGSHKQQQIERFLEQDQWQFVLDTVEMMRRDTDRDRRHYYRARYLLALLYLLGPRVSEIAGSTMGSMIEVRGRWWWFVTGKGGKQAKVPVNTDMIRALQEYRLSYGLSPMPAPTETTPLIMNLSGTSAITDNMIYRIVKSLVAKAADRIEANDPYRAAKLRRVSTHWFRHTSITHQADAGIGLTYLQRSARHSKLDTTSMYLHVEDGRWHDAMERHRLNGGGDDIGKDD